MGVAPNRKFDFELNAKLVFVAVVVVVVYFVVRKKVTTWFDGFPTDEPETTFAKSNKLLR